LNRNQSQPGNQQNQRPHNRQQWAHHARNLLHFIWLAGAPACDAEDNTNMKPPSQLPKFSLISPVARVFLLLLWLVSGAAASAQGSGAIPNASFEQVDEKTGVPVDWTPWVAENQAVYTLATAHSGVASALITDTDAKVAQGLRSRPVPVTAGQTYEATCWVKIAALEAGGFALYLEYWNGTQRVKDFSSSCNEVGEWRLLKVSAPAPANAETATVLIYGSSATIGVAYFDDAAIIPVK
jgi:hypothetical protein